MTFKKEFGGLSGVLMRLVGLVVFVVLFPVVILGEPGSPLIYIPLLIFCVLLVLCGLVGVERKIRLVLLPILLFLCGLILRGATLPRSSAAGSGKEIRAHVTRPMKPYFPLIGGYAVFAVSIYFWRTLKR